MSQNEGMARGQVSNGAPKRQQAKASSYPADSLAPVDLNELLYALQCMRSGDFPPRFAFQESDLATKRKVDLRAAASC